MERFDIAIIGLGGIGSATAWFASRAGQSVIGFERFGLGGHHHGASHDHSRIIRHSYHTPHYVALTRLAYDAWREVEAESGETCIHLTGGIDLFPRGAAIDIDTYRDSMQTCAVDFEEWSADDVIARWPAWHLDRDTQILYQADTGIVSPAMTVPLLQRLATRRGATLRGDATVASIEPSDDVVTIRLADGESVVADHVVVAADAWTSQLLAPLGV
ncbi:MAG TPA: FAD-dependent oxidoreductase, partial [Ilumatobacteraceae bacterium]